MNGFDKQKKDMAKKVRLTAYVERGKGKGNFSTYCTETVENCGLHGYGSTAREAMEDAYVGVQEYKEMWAKDGKEFPDVEFNFVLDIGSFFDYYPIDVTAFAKYIGMNASALRQYVAGIRYPRKEQVEKFQEGVRKFAGDLVTDLQVGHLP